MTAMRGIRLVTVHADESTADEKAFDSLSASSVRSTLIWIDDTLALLESRRMTSPTRFSQDVCEVCFASDTFELFAIGSASNPLQLFTMRAHVVETRQLGVVDMAVVSITSCTCE